MCTYTHICICQNKYMKCMPFYLLDSLLLVQLFWLPKKQKAHNLPHPYTTMGYAEVLLLCFHFSHLHPLLLITTSVLLGEYLAWSYLLPLKAKQTRLTASPLKRTAIPRQCVGSSHSLPSLRELSSRSTSLGNTAALTSRSCQDNICAQLLSKSGEVYVQVRPSLPEKHQPQAHRHIESFLATDSVTASLSKNFSVMGYLKVSYPNNHQVLLWRTFPKAWPCLAI